MAFMGTPCGRRRWDGCDVATHCVQPCYSESWKGDAAIKSQALGLLKPAMKRSQTPAFTVPYVVPGLCAKPRKYAWTKSSLKRLRGYRATISSRNFEENWSNPFPST